MFGSNVGSLPERAILAVHTSNVDDTPAVGDNLEFFTEEMKYAGHVDVDDLPPMLKRKCRERSDMPLLFSCKYEMSAHILAAMAHGGVRGD